MKRGQKVTLKVRVNGTERLESGSVTRVGEKKVWVKFDYLRGSVPVFSKLLEGK